MNLNNGATVVMNVTDMVINAVPITSEHTVISKSWQNGTQCKCGWMSLDGTWGEWLIHVGIDMPLSQAVNEGKVIVQAV